MYCTLYSFIHCCTCDRCIVLHCTVKKNIYSVHSQQQKNASILTYPQYHYPFSNVRMWNIIPYKYTNIMPEISLKTSTNNVLVPHVFLPPPSSRRGGTSAVIGFPATVALIIIITVISIVVGVTVMRRLASMRRRNPSTPFFTASVSVTKLTVTREQRSNESFPCRLSFDHVRVLLR